MKEERTPMRPNVVLDASILGHATGSDDFADQCLDTLWRAGKSFRLVLDHEDHILGEYDRIVAKARRSPVERWWVRLISVGSLLRVSGKIDEADKQKLLDAGFDKSDLPYVSVAKQAGGAPIVHQDRGYCRCEDLICTLAGARCLHAPAFIQELDEHGQIRTTC